VTGWRLTVWAMLISVAVGALSGFVIWAVWDSGVPADFYYAVLAGSFVGLFIWLAAFRPGGR
jgi:hypothetical protein